MLRCKKCGSSRVAVKAPKCRVASSAGMTENHLVLTRF
jgi:hypothetical protein